MKKKQVLGSQRGVALVLALMMLIVLTLIGLSSITTTVYEAKIAGNERFGNAAFYAAVGGGEVGIGNLPNIASYTGSIGSDENYRSGRMTDSGPQPLAYKGTIQNKGDEVTMWEYKRYQINATGVSFGARKEVEMQAKVGPYPTGTQYNN
jgi:Tfp pilus assembly protein PilX